MGIEAVLVTDISRKHLIDTARWLVNEPLLGVQYLNPLGECRTHSHHICRHIEHDGCLLPVGGAAVHLGAFLTITASKKQRHGSGKFGLALLLGNFDVCGIELAVAVGFQRSEDVADDLLLPVDEFKGLSCPGTFGVAQALNEHDRIVGGIFVIMRGLVHELCWLVLFQLSDMRSPPQKGYKKQPPPQWVRPSYMRKRASRLNSCCGMVISVVRSTRQWRVRCP